MNFSKAKSEPIQFQLAPMIDVVFLLLCFFITSTIYAQWESEMDITLPTAESGQNPQRFEGEIIINVHADGRKVVSGRSLSDAELEELLQRITELFPGQPVVIRGDEAAAFRHIVTVMDLCREADIFNFSIATGIPE